MKARLLQDGCLSLAGGEMVITPRDDRYAPMMALYQSYAHESVSLSVADDEIPPPGYGGFPWKNGTPLVGVVYDIPLEFINVDAPRLQYKRNANENGVTTELDESAFDPDRCDNLGVWKDPADGFTYVVDGHHRRELGERAKVETLPCVYIQAKDAKEAKAIGAVMNGREESVELSAAFDDKNKGHWVTTEEGQHVFIDDEGAVRPHGPGGKEPAKAKEPGKAGNSKEAMIVRHVELMFDRYGDKALEVVQKDIERYTQMSKQQPDRDGAIKQHVKDLEIAKRQIEAASGEKKNKKHGEMTDEEVDAHLKGEKDKALKIARQNVKDHLSDTPTQKEPWEMTSQEYEQSLKGQKVEKTASMGGQGRYNRKGSIQEKHQQAVAQALQLGKPVPWPILEEHRLHLESIGFRQKLQRMDAERTSEKHEQSEEKHAKETTSGAKPETPQKEQWQMTRDEHRLTFGQPDNINPRGGYTLRMEDGSKHFKTREQIHNYLDAEHKQWIKNALEDGEDVPPEVLADYPELAAKSKPRSLRKASNEPIPFSANDVSDEVRQEAIRALRAKFPLSAFTDGE